MNSDIPMDRESVGCLTSTKLVAEFGRLRMKVMESDCCGALAVIERELVRRRLLAVDACLTAPARKP